MAGKTLFEKYGGFSSVSKVVLSFYDRVLDNDDIGPFFDDVDMAKMVDHQTKFISSLLGGPASYTDVQLRNLHAHLAISDAQFDLLEEILTETLAAHGFDDEDIDAVLAEIEARRVHVIGRTNDY